ncbi:hypothetical protein [Mucilaginibacter psychrotolerans]|uniref:hypothetical protein n=1 Tax=Mucilaginibacter psychrotolerans TaxID=1524096 RepID=UPI00195D3C95|nr:hypothetical protein [Mucilaginibacter psychrotolerans]
MEPFGFDKLPEIVRQLFEKVEHIEKMLQKFEPKVIEENQLLNVSEAADFFENKHSFIVYKGKSKRNTGKQTRQKTLFR